MSPIRRVDPVPDPRTPRPSRVVALDVARGVGVIAMVVGHSYDALLSATARATPLVAEYWKLRGLTAPLFLLVAGWAGTLSILRVAPDGVECIRRKLPRIALLLGLGYALRIPAWNWEGFLAGAPPEWQHFLAFDVLHVIAIGILLGAAVVAIPASRTARGLLLGALAAGTAQLGGTAPAPEGAHLVTVAVAQAAGGTSPFPLFPWIAYFLAGGAIAMLASDVRPRRVAGMVIAGALLVGGALLHGMIDLPPYDPALVAFRMGLVLVALAALEWCPPRFGAALVRFGRSSLPVYVLHVAVVYGWLNMSVLAQRIGQRLALRDATVVALIVLAATFMASEALRAVRRRALALIVARSR